MSVRRVVHGPLLLTASRFYLCCMSFPLLAVDYNNGYLVQPVGRAEPHICGSDLDPGGDDEDPEIEEDLEEEDDEEDLDGEIQELPSSSSDKRKRNEDSHEHNGDDDTSKNH
ncbi:uncharacterized protein LOC142533082 [Primulina tabacum]|uniref:uncharacterized protein LOC142533082 n=1 Tax=Primulina tabacum TaxID=48773 RepID=UPI003F5A9DE6